LGAGTVGLSGFAAPRYGRFVMHENH